MWKLAALVMLSALTGPPLQAASVVENHEFDAAHSNFELGFWNQAEKGFAEFAKKYTNSEFYAQAIIYEAQALVKETRYSDAIYLLSAEKARAGAVADRFAFWTGQAQLGDTNYHGAAETFAQLLKDYPTSELRLRAAVGEAEAWMKLGDWPRVIETLNDPAGAFQQEAKAIPLEHLVVTGRLWLSEAEFARKDYAAAEQTLLSIGGQKLDPDMEWNRRRLLGRVQLAAGHREDALQTSAALLELAGQPGAAPHRGESLAFQAEVLEQMDRPVDAIAAYEQNLQAGLPMELRRQALLKIIDLYLLQNDPQAARTNLENFLAKYPTEKGTDVALLTSGEVNLKLHYQAGRPPSATEEPRVALETNLLDRAITNFTTLIATTTNNFILGKAQLNLGWCLLMKGKAVESEAAFSNAVAHLPLSQDQAVARFKLADAQYWRKDYAGSLANYGAVIEQYRSFPAVINGLFEQALYQMVRAALNQTNLDAASRAMTNLTAWYPDGQLLGPSTLMLGQGLAREGEAVQARDLLSSFAARVPDSPLLPEVQLAIARTYQFESDWTNAIAQYETWLKVWTNHPSRQKAEFALALVNSAAGRESNAVAQFASFVARYTNNALAPTAQYWVADHNWRQGNFETAEISYKKVWQTWSNSSLADPARLAAGKAAMAREAVPRAIEYFTYLTSKVDLPPALWLEAAFAYADALVKLPVPDYSNAIQVFQLITNKYPNTPSVPLAVGRLGECYFTMAGLNPTHYQYEAAITNFQMVMDSPLADASARSQAEVKLAGTLEIMAGRKQSEADASERLNRALAHYLNVVNEGNLRAGEAQDLFWLNEAGLSAGPLAEALGQAAFDAGRVKEATDSWKAELRLYQKLSERLPSMQQVLDKRISKLQLKLDAVERRETSVQGGQ
jgi:TolA-binding protein